MLGTLNQTVNHYAEANRTVTCQRLALSRPQVDTIVAALEREVRPENRYYPYHYLTTSCATRIRDLLDRVLDGALRRALEAERDHPVRHYARRGYAGHLAAELANDLFMGRLHDIPRSKYSSLYVPERLSLSTCNRSRSPIQRAAAAACRSSRRRTSSSSARGRLPRLATAGP